MGESDRGAIERAIGEALLLHWDPLGVRGQPGEHGEYQRYVPDVFSLLACGASDVQIARHLHRIETVELGHPELAARDLTAVLRTLRALERTF